MRVRRAIRVLEKEGVLSFSIKALQKAQKRQQRNSVQRKIKLNFLVKEADVLEADWTARPYSPHKNKATEPYTVNWVMSPPGKGEGGGHQNIFRFINHLIKQGYTCRAYLYSGRDFQDKKEAQTVFEKAHPGSSLTFEWLKGPMKPADAVFATGWETAYPVFNDPGTAQKFYFVQDFEPYFHPVGTEYVLSENTYFFNFFGITAGNWLAHKLNKEYGMRTDHYDFGADKKLYRFENSQPRKNIFFYARPVTTRRGFELGIMTLDLFHKQNPDYEIILAGWDVSDYHLPFPYKNLKTLKLEQLSDIYNQCAAGLVISLTNMSLMPLELLAAGTIPVVNDGLNNTEVSNNPYIKYAHPSPASLAQALTETVRRKDLPKYARLASESVKGVNWETSVAKFEEILRSELHG